jgi:quercetin dioxygenase-like cupin family protein
VRNLRNYGASCDGSISPSPRCAACSYARRKPQDFVADRRPDAGYVTILAEATIEAGASVARHTHPGIESAYVLEGNIEVPIQGQPTRMVKAGEGFQIPPDTPHGGGKPIEAKARLLVTYVVEKGKPLASPA